MARKVFFSFKYDDVARAMIVRNSWVTQDSAGFIDKADFEEVKRKGDAAIKKWIDEQLKGTTVTVVLVGENCEGQCLNTNKGEYSPRSSCVAATDYKKQDDEKNTNSIQKH